MAKELSWSNSTVKRYRNDINMQSPYKGTNKKKKTPNHLY